MTIFNFSIDDNQKHYDRNYVFSIYQNTYAESKIKIVQLKYQLELYFYCMKALLFS